VDARCKKKGNFVRTTQSGAGCSGFLDGEETVTALSFALVGGMKGINNLHQKFKLGTRRKCCPSTILPGRNARTVRSPGQLDEKEKRSNFDGRRTIFFFFFFFPPNENWKDGVACQSLVGSSLFMSHGAPTVGP